MFGLFKRTKIQDWENDLFINIFKKFDEYDYLKKQVEEGLLNRVFFDSDTKPNYVGFSYKPNISKKYEDKSGRAFTLKGLKVFDLSSGSFIDFEIYVAFGLITGYSTPYNSKFNLDTNRINIEGLKIEHLNDSDDFEKIKSLFNKEEAELINPSDVYEVELNGKIYYHLRDLEDGDFIGIDKHKAIYKITHDPFEITPLNSTIAQVLV